MTTSITFTEPITEPITGHIRGAYPSVHSIVSFIQSKYKTDEKNISEEQIFLIMQLYLLHEPSKKFFYGPQLNFDSTTLLSMPKKEYEDKEAEEEIKKKTYPKNLKKFYTSIANEMVAVYLRNTTQYQTMDSLGRSIVYYQSYGHVNEFGVKVSQQTLSSEILNHVSTTSTNYNVNLAQVCLQESLLLIRSGRSDNDSRIQELVQFAFISSWNSSNRPGITLLNDTPVFQLSIFSGQDPHPIRCALKIIRSSKKLPLDERTSLKEIKNSINKIWENKEYVTFQVIEDHKPLIFNAKKPLLVNFIISQSANNPQIIKDSRQWSEESVLREFSHLIHSIPSDSVFFDVFENHDEPMTKSHALFLIDTYKKEITNIKITTWEDEKLFLALKAIAISLTNKDFNDKEYLEPHDPVNELLYHYYLSNITNSAISVQCKAGCDRALIMTSLFLAKTQMEKKHKKILDLSNVDENVKSIFIKDFGKFCSNFGIPILSICRGSVEMKGSSKPFLGALFGPSFTKNSIQGLKLIK